MATSVQRILMTADTVGGVWTYALELCRALEGRGIDVVLATMGARLRAEQRAELASLRRVTLHESHFALEWMDHPWGDVDAAGDWLLDLEQRYDPDLVHLNGFVHAALPWNAPVLVVGHSCVLSWWRAVRKEEAPEEWSTYRQRVTEGIRSADVVVAPTAWMLRELQRFYGPLPHWGAIPNARSVAAHDDVPKEPFVLSLGRLWDEAKNAGRLAEIAHRLPWPVFLGGDSASPDGREVSFSNVRFLGRRSGPEAVALCRRAAIYALPARYEPFGLSALEAAQCGCALVLGDIPSLREVWGDAALYVPPEDPLALQEVLLELIRDRSHREERGRAARNHARRYSRSALLKGYVETYEALLARSGANASSISVPVL